MKITVSKSEIRECVSNAVMRIVNENRNQREDFSKNKKAPKHSKMAPASKMKGNKGNYKHIGFGDED